MTETQDLSRPTPPPARDRAYDRSTLTYATSFENPWQRRAIHTIEWLSGKLTILRMVREFERRDPPKGQAFWRAALDVMGIPLLTPAEQIARIPREGPVVLVANHPHGLVDGMLLADMIGRVRNDYRILTRSVLTGLDEEATSYMIPVPFPDEADAQAKMVAMREAAMAHLGQGGLVALFPSGVVASSDTMFGPVIERDWNVFTAKMIRKSRATVVPCFFPGANSRLYQVANRVSATLRQGLLIHEIVAASGKPHQPVIGPAIPAEEAQELVKHPRQFMAALRAQTLALGGPA